jgi:uncharacterized membrane protein
MTEQQQLTAEDVLVGIALDIRFLRTAATVALFVLVVTVVFAAIIYQRHALVAAALKG